MRRSLAFILTFVLLLALAVPGLVPSARAAADITMTATAYAPVIDGIIDATEWGERACTVNPFATTAGQPHFTVSGSGAKRPAQIDYWFRYDARYIYIAVRVTTGYFTYTDGDFRDGTYLVPRVDTDGDGVANYLGLLALGSDEVIVTRDNLLASMDFQLVGARAISTGVEYEIAYSRQNCTPVDGKLNIDLDYYTPGEGIVAFRNPITVSDEDPIPLDPSVGEPTDVLPLTGTVTIDGIAGAGEWGEADLTLSKTITGGTRNYCRDFYHGQGLGIPDTEFYWRYDSEWLYVALRLGESQHTGTSTFTYDDKICLTLGTKDYVIYLENKQARSVHVPKENLGFSHKDGITFCEMRIPLSEIDGGVTAGDTFTGYVEYYNVILYTDDDGYTQVSAITTHSVPNFRSGGAPVNAFTLKKGN